jgi:hypothetical protein
VKSSVPSLLLALACLAFAPAPQADVVNVAGRGVATSSQPLWGAADIARIIDGDSGTFVHADVAPAEPLSYAVDLGKAYAITEIRIVPRQDGCCADRLTQLRVSIHNDDGQGGVGTETWGTNVLTDGTNPGSTAGSLLTVPVTGSPSGRHIQVLSLASPIPDYALQIAELQAYADVPASEINRAANTVAASNRPLFGNNPARFLIDGNRNSLVHGTEVIESPFFYTINLGTEVKLNRIVVWARQDGCCADRLMNYRVSVHNDNAGAPGNAVWEATLHNDGSNPGSTGGSKDVLEASLHPAGTFAGQWIRIEALDNPLSAYTLQIAEIEAFGEAVGSANLLIAEQPASAAAGIGQTARFTVSAAVINGDPNQVTYQWHRNGSPITGATEEAYVTPPLLVADDKAEFHCVMSYPGLPDLVSAKALLRINLAYQAKASSNRPLWAQGGWNISLITDGNRTAALHGDTLIETGMAYEVDLGAPVKLEQIDIYPRQDGCCPERLANIRVSVLTDNNGTAGTEVWKTDLFTDGSNAGSTAGSVVNIPGSLDAAGTFEGQWIRILALDDPIPDYFLQMSEIEAFGSFVNALAKLEFVTQPSEAASAPGRTARFSTTAKVINGDPASIGYQWFRDGTAIPGATDSTYITPPLAAADTNSVFHCVLSYPGIASLQSDNAKIVFDYNYARGQPASSNRPLWGPGNWNISAIVDGNLANTVHGDTNPGVGFAYEIDLGTEVAVEQINIYPRQDGCCPERLSDLRVSLHANDAGLIGQQVWSADILTGGENAGSGQDVVVNVLPSQGTGVAKGHWLRILTLLDPVPDYFLQLTEVEVIGIATGPTPVPIAVSRSGNSIVLTWSATGFVLQETTNPGAPGSWTNVPNAPTSPATLPTSGSATFYRLRSQ